MLTNIQLVEYMEKVFAGDWKYWYGTCGYKCTNALYTRKKAQYPSHYSSSRKSGYMSDISSNSYCADCVGVIKSFFWTGGVYKGTSKYGSNNCKDTSANGMIAMCSETGAISTIPDIPGLVVWSSGHIGVYVGNGYVIEMKGFAYDCLRRKVSAGGWKKWGRLPSSMLKYVDGSASVNYELGSRTLREGMEGSDVKELQECLKQVFPGKVLTKHGADGDFGEETKNAVIMFQKKYGLSADGVYGAKSHKKLMDVLNPDEVPNDEDTPDEGSEDVRYVKIRNGNCYVRTGPSTTYTKLDTAHNGDRFVYAGETSSNGWKKIYFENNIGWCSGKYAAIE